MPIETDLDLYERQTKANLLDAVYGLRLAIQQLGMYNGDWTPPELTVGPGIFEDLRDLIPHDDLDRGWGDGMEFRTPGGMLTVRVTAPLNVEDD